MNQLDAATSYALSAKRAVAFLYSDETTFCTQCSSASVQAMESLTGSCIVVYVDRSTASGLPDKVKNALRSPKAGKYIPSVVVMSYDLKKVIAIAPFVRGDAYKKLLSETKEKILSYEK